MSTNEHLEELAADLASEGWRSKWPQDWTPEERAAYDRTPWSEKKDWWEEMWDKPLPVPGEEQG